jgi:hypothetical protein
MNQSIHHNAAKELQLDEDDGGGDGGGGDLIMG